VDGDEFRSRVATVTTPTTMLALGQNHPNPFNPRTTIPYAVPASAYPQHVKLVVLDVAGRLVRTLVDEEKVGGDYDADWEGIDDRGDMVSSGVYLYVLDVAGQRRARKMVLLK
jgi:flagellar hook assembly protein FlgD